MGAGGSRFDPREEQDTIDSFEELFKAVSGEWFLLLSIIRKIGENKQLAREIVVYLSECPDIASKVRIRHSFADDARLDEEEFTPLPPPIIESGLDVWPPALTGGGQGGSSSGVTAEGWVSSMKQLDHIPAGCVVTQTGNPIVDGLYDPVFDDPATVTSDTATAPSTPTGTQTHDRVRGFKFIKRLTADNSTALALIPSSADNEQTHKGANSSPSPGAAWGEPGDNQLELVAAELAASVSSQPPCPVWGWQLRAAPSNTILFSADVCSLEPPTSGAWVSHLTHTSSAMVVVRNTSAPTRTEQDTASPASGASTALVVANSERQQQPQQQQQPRDGSAPRDFPSTPSPNALALTMCADSTVAAVVASRYVQEAGLARVASAAGGGRSSSADQLAIVPLHGSGPRRWGAE